MGGWPPWMQEAPVALLGLGDPTYNPFLLPHLTLASELSSLPDSPALPSKAWLRPLYQPLLGCPPLRGEGPLRGIPQSAPRPL